MESKLSINFNDLIKDFMYYAQRKGEYTAMCEVHEDTIKRLKAYIMRKNHVSGDQFIDVDCMILAGITPDDMRQFVEQEKDKDEG